MANNQWQDMVNEYRAKQGTGTFHFVQEGKTRLRLVPQPGTESDATPSFFIESQGMYNKEPKRKMILLGILSEIPSVEIPDEDKSKITPVVVPPTVLSEILDILAEGHDLLSPDGHAIAILRTGKGLGTQYKVIVSPKPIELPAKIEYHENTLIELDVLYRDMAQKKSASNTPNTNSAAQAPAQAEAESGNGW